MSTEETEAPPVYDLTESGEDKVEHDGELRAANPDPNFNPDVNEQDAEIQDHVDENADEDGVTPDREPLEVDSEPVKTEFYVTQKLDERRLVPGSNPYLDDVERERAEIQRAKIEGREPDLENPPAVQGTPYVTTERARTAGLTTEFVEPDFVADVPVTSV
jgi:hypothetical protein